MGSPAGVGFRFESREARAGIERLLQSLDRDSSQALAAGKRECRVLLVEDNAFIGDMFAYGIGKFFEQRRWHVALDHAENAIRAREMLAATNYDLVIVDYYLPIEDGATFIACLRRDPRFARAPVVAISVGGRDAREATISAGADLFLDKPVVLRDLFRTLHALAQQGTLA